MPNTSTISAGSTTPSLPPTPPYLNAGTPYGPMVPHDAHSSSTPPPPPLAHLMLSSTAMPPPISPPAVGARKPIAAPGQPNAVASTRATAPPVLAPLMTATAARPPLRRSPIAEISSRERSNVVCDYMVGSMIGRGQFAFVHEATHVFSREVVAVKIIPTTRIPSEVQLQREVDAALQLNHRNVVRTMMMHHSDTHVYIFMELMTGGDLSSKISTAKRLEEPIARKFFLDLMLGLCYVHSRGVAHRDLKPENVLISCDGVLKISDFGFAGFQQPGERSMQTMCGSPHYIAPEVIRAQTYDGQRADVWSCGVILYYMIAGYFPFDDERGLKATFTKIERGTYHVSSRFSPHVRDLLSKMLIVEPNARLTAADVLEHPWLSGTGQAEAMIPPPSGALAASAPVGPPQRRPYSSQGTAGPFAHGGLPPSIAAPPPCLAAPSSSSHASGPTRGPSSCVADRDDGGTTPDDRINAPPSYATTAIALHHHAAQQQQPQLLLPPPLSRNTTADDMTLLFPTHHGTPYQGAADEHHGDHHNAIAARRGLLVPLMTAMAAAAIPASVLQDGHSRAITPTTSTAVATPDHNHGGATNAPSAPARSAPVRQGGATAFDILELLFAAPLAVNNREAQFPSRTPSSMTAGSAQSQPAANVAPLSPATQSTTTTSSAQHHPDAATSAPRSAPVLRWILLHASDTAAATDIIANALKSPTVRMPFLTPTPTAASDDASDRTAPRSYRAMRDTHRTGMFTLTFTIVPTTQAGSILVQFRAGRGDVAEFNAMVDAVASVVGVAPSRVPSMVE